MPRVAAARNALISATFISGLWLGLTDIYSINNLK